MNKAETLSMVIPFRNRPVDVFEVSLKSLELQTRQLDEVILVDVASIEPFYSDMKSLCEEYGVKHMSIKLDLSDKAIEVFLWNTCFNYGVKSATSDLVMYAAMDRVYEKNMVECVLDLYNWKQEQGREGLVCSKVWNLYRTPMISEVVTIEKLIEEAKYRGGYGYWCSSKEWIHKVGGLDESIRWYEDLDMARRMKLDRGGVLWTSHGRTQQHIGQVSRVIHLADHPTGRRAHGGNGIIPIAQRGKLGLRINFNIIRNDDNWGVVTEEKIRNAASHD